MGEADTHQDLVSSQLGVTVTTLARARWRWWCGEADAMGLALSVEPSLKRGLEVASDGVGLRAPSEGATSTSSVSWGVPPTFPRRRLRLRGRRGVGESECASSRLQKAACAQSSTKAALPVCVSRLTARRTTDSHSERCSHDAAQRRGGPGDGLRSEHSARRRCPRLRRFHRVR